MADPATVDAPAADTDNDALEATDDALVADVDEKEDALTVAAARKLRSENKSLRDRLKQAEKDQRERENGELSDKQRLERDLTASQDRIAALEADLRHARVQVAAHKIGITDPVAASKLLDWDTVDDPDDDKAVTRALRELGKKHPALLGVAAGADGSAHGVQGSEKPSLGGLIRREIGLRA